MAATAAIKQPSNHHMLDRSVVAAAVSTRRPFEAKRGSPEASASRALSPAASFRKLTHSEHDQRHKCGWRSLSLSLLERSKRSKACESARTLRTLRKIPGADSALGVVPRWNKGHHRWPVSLAWQSSPTLDGRHHHRHDHAHDDGDGDGDDEPPIMGDAMRCDAMR